MLNTLTIPSTSQDLDLINSDLATADLADLLAWGLTTYGDRIAQVTSFGPAGIVILDQLSKLCPGVHVITLDTQFLFKETYQLWEEIERRFAIRLDVRRPALSPTQQSLLHGAELWNNQADRCCHIRKVSPLADALVDLDAWISGIRRDQSTSRASTPLVDWDTRHGVAKLNPLAAWSRARVWQHVRQNNLPYNRLHDQGYASIGCTHCTRPARGNDERSGRWSGQVKTECGLHWG